MRVFFTKSPQHPATVSPTVSSDHCQNLHHYNLVETVVLQLGFLFKGKVSTQNCGSPFLYLFFDYTLYILPTSPFYPISNRTISLAQLYSLAIYWSIYFDCIADENNYLRHRSYSALVILALFHLTHF